MMRLYPITKRLTLWGRLANTIAAGILVFWLTLPIVYLTGSNTVSWLVFGLAAGWFLFQVFSVRAEERLLEDRTNELLAFAQTKGADFSPAAGAGKTDFGMMSLFDLGTQRDRLYRNFMKGNGWAYCDYSYEIYRRTKNGEYRVATVHYAVMAMPLPRKLPNVFFDSHKARRRQFRFHFSRAQRQSLEGDFDRYFATYFPEEYTIDGLSFITPDVMLALKAADDYDVEIVGDKLLLYGPLDVPERQLPDIAAKAAAIRQQLLDNILTYRDERLPFAEGRRRVHVMGASLRRSQLIRRLGIAAGIAYVLGRIILEIWVDQQ